MYTAVVLDIDSVERLKNAMNIPQGIEQLPKNLGKSVFA